MCGKAVPYNAQMDGIPYEDLIALLQKFEVLTTVENTLTFMRARPSMAYLVQNVCLSTERFLPQIVVLLQNERHSEQFVIEKGWWTGRWLLVILIVELYLYAANIDFEQLSHDIKVAMETQDLYTLIPAVEKTMKTCVVAKSPPPAEHTPKTAKYLYPAECGYCGAGLSKENTLDGKCPNNDCRAPIGDVLLRT